MLFRAYHEKYNHLRFKMLRLVTLSAPLGGFYCGDHASCYPYGPLPQWMVEFMSKYIYTDFVQNLIGPCDYWRDPYNLSGYFSSCHDLPDLDNERVYTE